MNSIDLAKKRYSCREESFENEEIDTEIAEAVTEYKHNGELFDAEEAFSSLRRKYFG